MKQFLLCMLLAGLMMPAMAQGKFPLTMHTVHVSETADLGISSPQLTPSVNPTPKGALLINRKASLVDVGLWTYSGISQSYDRQSQGSVYPMTQRHSDGFIGSTWTNEDNPPFSGSSTPKRGVGYSYSTNGGLTWSAQENRVGGIPVYWPSYAQWGANGEAILARSADTYTHGGVQIQNGLVLMTRPNKGTGNWTITPVPYPAGTSPGAGYVMAWARMTTSGDNHQYIHIMSPMSTPDSKYPTYYYRTQNGGNTWDVQGQLVPAMVGEVWSEYCFYTDGINFAVKGNTVACSFIDFGNHGYVLRSLDNGNTWESIKFFDSPVRGDLTPANYSDTVFIPSQGCIVIDNNGKIHVAFSAIMAINSDYAGNINYFTGVISSFLSYWNEDMGQIDGATEFVKHKIYPLLYNYFDWSQYCDFYVISTYPKWPVVGYFTPINDDHCIELDYYDIQWAGTSYNQAGMFSFPQMTFDNENRVRLSYLGVLDNGYDGNDHWYRHPFYTISYNDGQTWTKTEYLVNNLDYIDREFAYLTSAGFDGNKMYLMAQTDDMAGTYIHQLAPEHWPTENFFTYFTVGGPVPPPPPPPLCSRVTNVTAEITEDCTSATITWTAVNGATGYEVRRDNILLGTVTTPSFTETAQFVHGKSYTWQIKTLCGANTSMMSAATSKAICEFCDPVTDVTATITPSCMLATITWSAVNDAKKYEIRRDGNLLGSVTTPSFSETFNFEHGNEYIWTIKTICNESESNEIPAAATADCVCNPVTNLIANPPMGECSSILISWDAPTDMPDAKYNIYKDGIKIASDVAKTEYVDYNVELNVEYTWTVKTICVAGESTGVDVKGGCKTSITELANSISIYPNPTSGTITVTAKNFLKVEVYNPVGQLIETKTDNIFDVSSYNTGIYFFKVFDVYNNRVTKRVMVTR